MSSGYENIVINPLERAVSTDINRLESFAGADISELFRFLLNVSNGFDDLDAAGVMTEFSSTGNPLRTEIIDGFGVKPQIGSLDLLIDRGVLFCLDPDSPASPDDSAYKYIRDPGISSTGVLGITANSSGSTRFDVIECARVAPPGYSVLETDSRDIFNPTTGLFTPTTVNKVIAGRLQYRVRLGTPGSGFPGTASGWTPLCVAMVPTATTTNDTVVFWDVRPMLEDREFNLSNTNRQFAALERNSSYSLNTGGNLQVSGQIEAKAGGRKLGGIIRPSAPVADNNFILLGPGDTNNWASGLSLSANNFYCLYLLTPFGLPRWARYTDSGSGTRKPRSPRGIFVLSNMEPNTDNRPSSAISLPAYFGGGTSSEGLCVAVYKSDNTASSLLPLQSTVHQQVCDFAVTQLQTAASFNNTQATFNMNAGSTWPGNARAVHVQVALDYHTHGAGCYFGPYTIRVLDHSGNTVYEDTRGTYGAGGPITGTVALSDIQGFWIPVPQVYPASPFSNAFSIVVFYNLTATTAPDALNTVTGASLFIDGWELW